MISASEAKEFKSSKVREELDKLDRAIRLAILNDQICLILSTGLTKEAQQQQNKLYKDFQGYFEDGTMATLIDLGYEIAYGSSYQGSWVTIGWG